MNRPIASLALVLAALTVPAAAAAQPAPGPTAPILLDRFGETSSFTAELGFARIASDSFDGESAVGVRTEGMIHWVAPSGVGGYGVISFAKAFGDIEDDVGVSDLEGGVTYAARASEAALLFRLGLGLPTASEEDGLLSNYVGVYSRLTDLARIVPAYLLRPSVSIATSGVISFRGDLGLDIAYEKDEGFDGERDTAKVLRANAGIGFDTGGAVLLGELCSLWNAEDSVESDALFQIGGGVRFKTAGQVQPAIGISTVFGDAVDTLDVFGVTAGLTGAI